MYKMMVVDDERAERSGIAKLVKACRLPVETVEAVNGREALHSLSRQPVDILLTDIRMPFMNGLELASLVKQSSPGVKIIIFSAYGEFEYAREAVKLDVVHYILKPVVVDEFLEVMNKVVQLCEEESRRIEREREYHALEQLLGNRGHATPAKWLRNDADAALPDRRIIHSIVNYIAEHYMEDISLESIGKAVYLSPGYLSSIFKKETGQSLSKFITAYRLDVAKTLLEDPKYKVVDVAKNVGFTDTSYFCLVFKNYVGISPARYKELNGR